MLAVIESHPVQYHAPVYREVQQRFGVPVTVIYGSDFSVAGYRDAEFGVTFAWDTDLLAGYSSVFLTRSNGGTTDAASLRARGVGALLKQLKPDAVMLVGYGSRFDREACFEAWRTGLPLIFRAETTDHAVTRSPVRAWMRDSALRVLYSRMSRILYIGQRSKAHYQRLGVSDEKLVFSPYCVDTTPFECDEAARERLRGPARAAMGVSEDDVVILFSGKLSERKGPDLLIGAAKLLPADLRNRICVCFLGDGDMREQVRAQAAAEPAIRAVFPGFQNQRRLSPYYHAADFLVLPSRQGETWGLVVNEALHHGLPCVTSDAVGCADDLIQPDVTGVTFSSGSLQDLRRALSHAIHLSRGEKASECRARVGNYTLRYSVEGLVHAYLSVQGPRSTASLVGVRL